MRTRSGKADRHIQHIGSPCPVRHQKVGTLHRLSEAFGPRLAHSKNEAPCHCWVIGLTGRSWLRTHLVPKILERYGPAQSARRFVGKGLTILRGPIANDIAGLQNLHLECSTRQRCVAEDVPKRLRNFRGARANMPDHAKNQFVCGMLKDKTPRLLAMGLRSSASASAPLPSSCIGPSASFRQLWL
jgi:hypothetical protein